ncbi:Carbonyl reductase [NADPH] [Echinococcus granulosus]|uniref:Carbonyl reductase [NADPH] n=1 Tax=Echinococcus granulosus TaxID=6210 RepID=W6UIZ6_ECHGR|nr:Carbonyl reductase [NADPH] [Echinococcus granulosus]EUB61003.1 Carbonyl reductase [NADPH] [Echinococcus granulosus]
MYVAIATGANKGIGNGIVELLVQGLKPASHWHVCLTAQNEKLGLEAVKVLEDRRLSVKFHQLDITDADSRHKLAEFMKANYPDGIDILANNAGTAYKTDSTAPFGEQARVTIATNYTATVKMCTGFLPLMAKDSRLVNVASMAAMMSLRAMSKEMAAKFKGRLTLQECCPGYVDTNTTSHKGPKTILEGADTPVYLATLPKGVTEPYGQLVSERQVVDVDKEGPL